MFAECLYRQQRKEEHAMGNPQDSQQQKKQQAQPGVPNAKDGDFKKQGADPGKKTWPAGKDDDDEDDEKRPE
jgi:hypothetical protein